MASQGSKFAVGLFVAGGMGIALLAVIWLGMSRFLEKGQYYAVYFNESVQGLNVDSPVKYRGVSIGRVDSIGVAPDSKLIQVILKIESAQSLADDIVAQLKSVGITGIMFVELDRMEKGDPDRTPSISFPSEYPIVASKPSNISELLRGIGDVLTLIKSVDLSGISDKVKLTLDSINQKVSEADVKGISEGIESSFERVDRILDDQRWGEILASVDDTAKSLKLLMRKAGRSMNRVEKTLARVEGIVEDKENVIKAAIDDFRLAMKNANVFLKKGSSLVTGTNETLTQLKGHLLVVAQNMEIASENLNRLAELLADQPSQLLFGEPPPRREIEPDDFER